MKTSERFDPLRPGQLPSESALEGERSPRRMDSSLPHGFVRGGYVLSFSLAAVLPIIILALRQDRSPPEMPVAWSVGQFCDAGKELLPPSSLEMYEYRYSASIAHLDEVTLVVRPDGTGTLYPRRFYPSWPRVVRATPEIDLMAEDLACLRGVIKEMSFWADYDEAETEFLCVDGDSFDLSGKRQGERRVRSGHCDSWGYGPYVMLFEHVLDRLVAFPGGQEVQP